MKMSQWPRWQVWLLGAVMALAVAGCGLLPDVKDETASWSAEQLYRNAHEAMLDGNYTRAIKLFETLEARYPYGRFAQQAILEGAFANWRQSEQATATAASASTSRRPRQPRRSPTRRRTSRFASCTRTR